MLHNLLDRGTQKSLRNEYHARVATVGTLLAAAAVAIGILANIPAYVYVRGELGVFDTDQVQQNTSTFEDATDNSTLQAIAEMNMHLSLLEQNLQKDDLAKLLTAALSERPEGVVVTGFSYNEPESRITVEGVAKDRDVFRTYAQNLDAHPRFADVPQPISNLAKNTDLPFRLSFEIISQTTK